MKKSRRVPLQGKMFQYVGGALVALISLAAVLILYKIHGSVRENKLEIEKPLINKNVLHEVTSEFELIIKELGRFEKDYPLMSHIRAKDTIDTQFALGRLKTLKQNQSLLDDVGIVDLKSDLLIDNNGVVEEYRKRKEARWLKRFLGRQQPVEWAMDPKDSTRHLFVNYKIFDENQQVVGVLFSGCKIDAFQNRIAQYEIGEKGTVILTDASGRLIAFNDRKIKATSKHLGDIAHLAPFANKLTGGQVSEEYAHDGETRTIFISPVPNTEWFLVSDFSVDEVTDPIVQSFLVQLLVLGVLVIALILALVSLVGRFITAYLKELTLLSEKVSRGDLEDVDIAYQGNISEFHQLSDSYRRIIDTLTDATGFARAIGEGKYDAAFRAQGENDRFGQALLKMRDSLRSFKQEERRAQWFTEGLAKFSETLRMNNQNLSELSDQVLRQLVKLLEFNQGALFLLEGEGAEEGLRMASCYAYGRKKHLEQRIAAGEGITGQVLLEKETVYLTEIPADYVAITSGLGEALPNSILIVPLMNNQVVQGVVELAAFRTLEPYEIEFVEKVAEATASTISLAKINEKTKQLLEESQLQAEEMRAQEEEMRQNLEELTATQEEILRVQQVSDLRNQFAQKFIDAQDRNCLAISQSLELIMVNQKLSAHFKSLGFSIEEGDRLDQKLPEASWDYWKKYINRGLSGERILTQEKNEFGVDISIDITPILNESRVAEGILIITEAIESKEKIVE